MSNRTNRLVSEQNLNQQISYQTRTAAMVDESVSEPKPQEQPEPQEQTKPQKQTEPTKTNRTDKLVKSFIEPHT